MSIIDLPEINDNRKYDYTDREVQFRSEYGCICDMIEPESSVIDLGCGNGSLLAMLKDKKSVAEMGIELVKSGVDICCQKGLNVRQGAIDILDTYSDIDDKQFNYAICNVTIQMLMYPEVLLAEMKRIAKYQIVSFPNFATWRNRLDLLLNGRMPKPMLFGYTWYNTGHIHQLSIKDFKDIAHQLGMKIKSVVYYGSRLPFVSKLIPNLFANNAIYLLEDR